jgi:histone acetyltransferase (RNA polymerase elongator complex component)
LDKPFIVPVFIPHAGCPHRCVFCNQTCTTGRHIPLPDPESVRTAVDAFLTYSKKPRPCTEIAFFGGNFLGLALPQIESLLSVAAEYVHRGQAHGIRFSTRPDTIDEARLDILRRYPVSSVELGVQSMNDAVLRKVRRGHTVGDTLAAVALLKQYPYNLGLQIMTGLPGEGVDDTLDGGRRLAVLEPDFVRIYPTLVLKESLLATWYAKKQYLPPSLEQAVAVVKQLYLIFAEKGIAVIRMGLQATTDLSSPDTVLAGPYHPAFGELVQSALILDALKAHLESHPPEQPVLTLTVNSRNLSRLYGRKHANLALLRSQFSFDTIRVHTDDSLGMNSIRVDSQACAVPLWDSRISRGSHL